MFVPVWTDALTPFRLNYIVLSPLKLTHLHIDPYTLEVKEKHIRPSPKSFIHLFIQSFIQKFFLTESTNSNHLLSL